MQGRMLTSGNWRKDAHTVIVGDHKILFFDRPVHHRYEGPVTELQELVEPLDRNAVGRVHEKLLLAQAGQRRIVTLQPCKKPDLKLHELTLG